MLDALTAGALEDAETRRGSLPYDELDALARASRTPIDVVALLSQPVDGVHVIAEVKRASPSKGRIADIPEPAELAAAYAAGGASVISVLTEGRRFLGTLDDLRAVRGAVDVPVLRKDFLASRYQLLEARAAGADLVLLIVAALDDATLADLHAFATGLGLSVLVEVHDADEVRRALAVGARIVGVNTRDLQTFQMHPERFAELRPLIPEGVVAVAESGVQGVDDVRAYRTAGAHAVLVGEALVRDGDPAARVAAFRSAS
ncbi:indole-3-glycerol phosphate synthase TrpC [Agrococcus sp. SGAir0287]|uniref:indole-3-glycerol phosphate synthase TrpC n=1 Tax=Agrococcus sp. SGAir0287 TaxID=2070347 RepID=UPI0010CD2AB1|nr:indole-3-glycerol phosphate synthase TrpC [Agrococcus sp. SGAir0287]QCR19294.1 indole-3-glycerol phosphate synthase TrpC [Agrococcus sp. SGAir0287]